MCCYDHMGSLGVGTAKQGHTKLGATFFKKYCTQSSSLLTTNPTIDKQADEEKKEGRKGQRKIGPSNQSSPYLLSDLPILLWAYLQSMRLEFVFILIPVAFESLRAMEE